MKLYHVTTINKVKKYNQTGFIKSPVRGFNNITAALAWAVKSGRGVILSIDSPDDKTYLLPDHHNKYGSAYWCDCNISEWNAEFHGGKRFDKLESA